MSIGRTVRGVGEMALAYLGLSIIPFIPRSAIVRLARRLGDLMFRLSGKTRRIALANIDIVFGDTLSPEEKKNIARQSFKSLCLVLLDLFWFARNTSDRIRKYVVMDASSVIMKSAKPAIAVTGHFGNWEILGQTVALVDPPFLAIAAHLKNSVADRLVTRLRSGGSQRVAYKEGAMREAVNVLKEGGRVGLLLDQNVLPKAGGVFVDFFGLPVPMSSAAERLSKLTGLPIIFGFCVPDDRGYYRLYSPPAIPLAETGTQDGVVTQTIARSLEAEIRRNPGCWLWMYKRWKYISPGTPREKYPFYSRPMIARGRNRELGGAI